LIELCDPRSWGNVGEMEPQNAVPNIAWSGNHWLPFFLSNDVDSAALHKVIMLIQQSWSTILTRDPTFLQEHNKTTITLSTWIADSVPLLIPVFEIGDFNWELMFLIHAWF
jgi:hypothetical protein